MPDALRILHFVSATRRPCEYIVIAELDGDAEEHREPDYTLNSETMVSGVDSHLPYDLPTDRPLVLKD